MKPIKESPPKTRRKFDAIFKREAVGNWLSSLDFARLAHVRRAKYQAGYNRILKPRPSWDGRVGDKWAARQRGPYPHR